MLSPIQTRRHWIRKIVFEPRLKTIEESKCEVGISVKERKCGDHWHVKLNVRLQAEQDGDTNYRGQFEFEGIFDVHPDFPKDKITDLVRMNGGAILYGAVRELILTLTSRSNHGPFEMPTMDTRVFLQRPETEDDTKKSPKTPKD
ncbi:MAG: hypothetical protein EOP06_19150 [Proteobacteria bacterium]|nr:MAG: hypothetical protein EOP06_19150 [Pseudomonadota bacterium]